MRMTSLRARTVRPLSAARSAWRAAALGAGALALAGCGLFSGPEPTPTPTRAVLAPVATFTPTPEGAAPAPASPADNNAAAAPQQPVQSDNQQAAQSTQQDQAPTETPAPTATEEANAARFTVKQDLQAAVVNVRSGPSTGFGVVGTIARGAQHEISGRNVENTWYQFSFNGQPAWIFSSLVNVENPQLITIAINIPPTPVPPTATPVPPTPVPAPTGPCDPPPDADGCKFKVLKGPKTGQNNGSELKLMLGFVRVLGTDKYEWQGSYFVGLSKDGTQVMPKDDEDWKIRSRLGTPADGTLGLHNYDYNLKPDRLGGNVNGNYTIWVMDGNGKRDSENFTFTVSDNKGEVWFIFTQN